MLLNYQPRFAKFVEEGSKTQTIRARRKYPAKAGDTLHHYTGLRQNKYPCRKLLTSANKSTRTIIFKPAMGSILICEERLSDFDVNAVMNDIKNGVVLNYLSYAAYYIAPRDQDDFAWDDGFRFEDDLDKREGAHLLMKAFWDNTHALPFIGDIYKW